MATLRSRGAIAAALALALGLLAPRAAWADARTEARRHFKNGMQLIAEKRYQEGIKELEKANELVPHPNVLFNIARAEAEAGQLEAAIATYKQYLASDPPDSAQVSQVLAQLEDKLAAERAPQAPPPVVEAPKPATTDKPGAPTTGPEKPGEPAAPKPPPVATKPKGPATEQIVGEARNEDVYRETIVTAARGAQSPLDAPSSTTILTKQDIHLSGITRIPELLRRVAGMDVMEITGGDTNVSMRGFNSRLSNKLLVLVNGRSVYNDVLGSTFWETFTIDVDQIERIEIVRGPGSALYGADAFTGVVNIITIAPGEGRPGMRVGYGDHQQTYGSGWVTGREGDFAYRASVGYTRYPRWTTEANAARKDLTITSDFNQALGADNYRADLRMSERLPKGASLELGGGFATGDLDVYGIGPFNDYALSNFQNSDITADFKSKHVNVKTYWERLHGTAGTDYDYYGHTLYPSNVDQNSFDVELEYVGDFKLPESVQHDVHVGGGYRLKKITWDYLEPDIPIENHFAAYGQDTATIGKHLILFASGRVDYVPYLQKVIGSPRGTVIVKPTEKQAIRLSAATAFRQPTFLEAYLNLPVELPLPGAQLISSSKPADSNKDFILQPEQITTVEVNYLVKEADWFDTELNAYYNRVTDLVELSPVRNATLSTRAEGDGGFDPVTGQYTVAFGGWDNQCATYNVLGGEAGVRVYPLDGLDLFVNYALNVSKQSIPTGCNVAEDQRTSVHKLNAGVQVRTKFGLNGEITFNYQSSQNWAEQVATLDRGIVYENFPLPAYTLLNGRLGFRFYKDKAEIAVTVFNALADAFGPPPQQHPFGNRVGRRVMGFLSYNL